MVDDKQNGVILDVPEGLPTLTLGEDTGVPAPAPLRPAQAEVVATQQAPQEYLDERTLTVEEKKLVNDFSEKIDVGNSAVIMQYGAGCQKKIANFSESALQNVRTKDLGEVGEMISNLVVELKGFSLEAEEEKGFMGFFKKTRNNMAKMKARYDMTEVNVEKIANILESHQVQLLKDISMLDKMYALNLNYFKELTLYIIAGKKKLAKERETTLAKLMEDARATGLPEDAQRANDYAAMCDRFEKKLHDLELTRMVSIQMSPQIRLVQNNDVLMTEKIQSTLVNTIPLWKNQMVLSLGLAHSQQAMEAQREVSDLTNELLRKNADTLKIGTVAVAKESERGIVDIETLRHTNQQLISTLDEVIQIQEQGRQKRREAEVELGRIEGELKQKLLDIRG